MASIYKKIGSKHWHCSYTLADGRRVYKSTKKSVRSEAMAEAVNWEKQAQAERAAVLVQQSKSLALLRRAAEMAESGRLDLAAARGILDEILHVSIGEKLPTYTTRSWLEEWLAGRQGTASAATLSAYKTAITHFLAHLGEVAETPLASLRESHLREFREKQLAAGKAARTSNQSIKILGLALRDAFRQGLISRNPAEALHTLREEDSTEREAFTTDELKAILGHAAPSWKGMVLLGFYAGLRLEDAARLRWSNLDLEKRKLVYRPEKTRHRKKGQLEIPLHSTLLDFLLSMQSTDKPDAPLFPDLCEKQSGGRGGLSRAFLDIMAAAGVDSGVNDRREGKEGTLARRVHRKSFHSLRHTHVSGLANASVPAEIRKKITGHASDDVHEGYTHHDWQVLQKSVNKLPEI